MTDTKKEGTVRMFHTGGIYGPLDTEYGRLSPGGSLKVSPELAKKFTRAYKHVKLASDVIPAEKDSEATGDAKKDAEKIAALTKDVEELDKRGEKMGEKFGEDIEKKDASLKDRDEKIELLFSELNDLRGSHKDARALIGEFLKVSDKKLKDLQKKHADVLKPKGADKSKP